jgi:hypothetical protein
MKKAASVASGATTAIMGENEVIKSLDDGEEGLV